MTFRDDHDAALDRADALEDEVERKDKELAKTKKRLETNDEELGKLRAENARLRNLPVPREKPVKVDAVVPHPRPAPEPFDRWRESQREKEEASYQDNGRLLAIIVALVILAGLGVSTWIILKGRPQSAEKSRVQSGSGR